jgi:tRNA threonylcarbamoyladenosine biosynthesis protein TsaE
MFNNFKEIITNSAKETKEFGKIKAKNIKGGEIFCLKGDLGAGKTTFSQGFLRGLEVKGAITSPTFVVMKQYDVKNKTLDIKNIYHIDTYRVESVDVLALGWEEIIKDKKNVILVEWPEKIKDIIPAEAIWLEFELVDKDMRKIRCFNKK